MYNTNKIINGLDAETTIADTDELVFGDVSDTNRAKKITFANLKTEIVGDDTAFVRKSDYDANTILYATSDNTPVALTVGTNSVVGRVAGNITTLAVDSDLTAVSASDDTVPSAKATKTALDLKANDADVVHDTGDETIGGIKTFSSDPLIPDEAYGSGWNGVLEPPTKNAVYDKIESLATFPSDYVVGVGTNTTTKTYNNFQIPWIISTDVPSGNFWTSSSTSSLVTNMGYIRFQASGDVAHSVITTNGIGMKVTSGSGADIAFGDGKDVICEFTWTRVGAASEQSGFGFATSATPFSTYNDTTVDAACFTIDTSGNLYGHTCDGAAQTNSSAITGVTLTNNNTYRIEVNDGVDVKFYVNGVLKATNTTNLPNSGTIKFGAGGSGNGNDNDRVVIGPVTFAIEK